MSNDGVDRGLEFRYYNGSSKIGFMGYSNNQNKFLFIPEAVNTSEVFSGTKGVLVADLEGKADQADVLSNNSTTSDLTINGTTIISNLRLGTIDITATATEINYLSGLTEPIQTQINALPVTDSPTFTGTVGINTSSPINSLDVTGGVVIGSSTYTGTATAPTNGLIVEGNVGIGTSSPDGLLVVSGSGKIDLQTTNTSDGIKIGTSASSVPISIGNITSEVTVNDNLTVTGDITINGTSTIINSVNFSVRDSVLTIGESSPSISDLKDRCIEFKYYDSTVKT